MSSPFVVPDGWTITNWETGPAVEGSGIPADGFKVGGPMNISPEPVESSDTFSLIWLNDRDEPCGVSGLRPSPEAPEFLLTGQNLLVSFGTTQVVSNFTVVLSTDPKTLTISLSLPEPESADGAKWTPNVGSGTVTATANPDPPMLVEVVAVRESIPG